MIRTMAILLASFLISCTKPVTYNVERMPNSYRFSPQPDITTYELALAMATMFGGLDYVERIKPTVDAMPPEARRHWLPPQP